MLIRPRAQFRDVSSSGVSGAATVEDLAALKALNNRPASVIVKSGQAAGTWQWVAGDSTTADDALVVQCTSLASGRYKRIWSGDINVLWFGAVGDGSTDDLAALTAAVGAAQTLGGKAVYLPATGAAYVLSDTLACGNGVKLKGEGTFIYPGPTATISQWTAYGTWIRPTHTSNPGIRPQGNGSSMEGINIIHSQPVPDGSFTPTTYGYAIRVTGTAVKLKNIRIVSASHGIHWDYTGTAGGTNCTMDDVLVSAFNVGIKVTNVNDVMYCSKIDIRNLYYSSTTEVVDYIRANRIGCDCGYWDNPDISGWQDFQSNQAFKFTDGTVASTTHSLYNATIRGMQFNLVTKAMTVDADDTTVWARFADVLLQSYSDFDSITSTDRLINLDTSNANVSIDSLHVNNSGGGIASVGVETTGTGGRLDIGNLYVGNYSSATAGQTGFVSHTNAVLSIGNYKKFTKTAGSGARFGGAGVFKCSRITESLYDAFADLPNTTLTGTSNWLDIGTTKAYAPATHNFVQARLRGSINVTTLQADATFALRFSGQTTVTATGISGASTGFKNFDSGWIDLTDTSTTTLGRPQIAGTADVVVQDAEMILELR